MKAAFRVIAPGPHTSIQDIGRFGFEHMGVPVSGALDPMAHCIANWLVGNPEDCATLEITMGGPSLQVLTESDIALTGAAFGFTINGRAQRQWRTIRVRPDDLIRIAFAESGCRAYLAVGGGIAAPLAMGSRSTFASANLGGVEGRLLREGDILKCGDAALLSISRTLPFRPLYPREVVLRAVPGPYDNYFKADIERFFQTAFTVSAQTNRMGCRLDGPAITRDEGAPQSIVSEPVVPGNVQVPSGGQPIILMHEQTIGGYTSIATVISSDLFKVAQAAPGDTVRFVPVSLADAHQIYRRWHEYIQDIKTLIIDPAA